MKDMLVRGTKLFFMFGLFLQVSSLPVFAEGADSPPATESETVTEAAAQPEIEKPSSPTEIQKALTEAGYYKGTVDGVIGAKTRAAIRSFQGENGLTADGKVGPKTWEKLKAYLEEAKDMDEGNELAQTPVEESTDYNMTVEPEPEPLATEGDLKQKLVS